MIHKNNVDYPLVSVVIPVFNVADYVGYLRMKENILCSLLFLTEKENIDLAYPSQTLYVQGKEKLEE